MHLIPVCIFDTNCSFGLSWSFEGHLPILTWTVDHVQYTVCGNKSFDSAHVESKILLADWCPSLPRATSELTDTLWSRCLWCVLRAFRSYDDVCPFRNIIKNSAIGKEKTCQKPKKFKTQFNKMSNNAYSVGTWIKLYKTESFVLLWATFKPHLMCRSRHSNFSWHNNFIYHSNFSCHSSSVCIYRTILPISFIFLNANQNKAIEFNNPTSFSYSS